MKSYVYIETYGCSANQNNSEIMQGLLKQSGYELTTNEKIAEIIIINSCIVKGKTETKIKRRIQDLSKEYPKKLLIISGCMPNTDVNQLKKLNPKLILLGITHIKDIVKIINDVYDSKINSNTQKQYLTHREEEKVLLPKIAKNKLISITQISEGCLGDCTYCKTRLSKGKLFSYPMDKIVKSIENDLSSGAKEVWITSQDNASYGLDKGENKLIDLLEKILSLNHRFKIRLGMMNPNHVYPILDRLIEVYKNPKMYKFIHIPIQSASDNVLKDMNRPYKIKIVEEIIEKFKKEFPDITVSTDIIVGYPTETDLDHKKNLEFIDKYRPDVLNLSKFSSHKSTQAGKMIPLNKEILNKRNQEIMNLHRDTASKNKNKFLGKTFKVFIDEKKNSFYESRDDNYNIILIQSTDKSLFGKTITVKIKQIGVHHMIGEVV